MRARYPYLVARRLVQASVIAMLWGGAHLGWTLARGDLSSTLVLGTVPLSDPFALFQVLATGHLPATTALLGGAVTLGVYLLLGGRAWCAWVCPVNPVADLAGWLRRRLSPRGLLEIDGRARLWMAAGFLVLSALLGTTAFEMVSPIGLLQRDLVYGLGAGLLVVPFLLVLDTFVLRHGWCGSLCPLGGFWSVVGAASLARVRFDAAKCDRCGDCAIVCPESQVLRFGEMARTGLVRSGDCSNCLRCVEVCPHDALALGSRFHPHSHIPEGNEHAKRQSA